MNDEDKLKTIKALWEQYNAANAESQKALQRWMDQEASDMDEIVRKARHEVQFGQCNMDLALMVANYNSTYGTQIKASQVLDDAEVWVLEQSWKGAPDA